ncbi:glycosyltransferase [Propioniciclava soli]|uniref:Glycosyltransferase n=1 Tax=Propioniciclava soli TaxID=2775081 RepID=A0ABZ3C8X4_9ACTN
MVHIDLPDWVRRQWRRDWDMYWYYALWQRLLAKTAKRLHASLDFDVAHHVTFANDWLPSGLTDLRGVPFIWGPVGGASLIPYWRLRRWLGWRGVVNEVVRDVVTAAPRRLWGETAARRAALIVAQNNDVARRFACFGTVEVHPNASLDRIDAEEPRQQSEDRPRTAVYVGRLIGLKGVRLALDALARTEPDAWRLVLYGDGYDREALEERARDLGIVERVTFLGHRPRPEVLAAFETADALLFPSMHDQAGWVAAEASSVGCPVVCLPLGGPPVLAEPNGFVADLEGDIVANVAAKLEEAGGARGVRHNRWAKDRLPALVERWYDAAIAEGPGRS